MDDPVRENPTSPVAAAQHSCLRKSERNASSRGWFADIGRAWRLIVADLPNRTAAGTAVTPEEWGELDDRKVLFMDPRVKVLLVPTRQELYPTAADKKLAFYSEEDAEKVKAEISTGAGEEEWLRLLSETRENNVAPTPPPPTPGRGNSWWWASLRSVVGACARFVLKYNIFLLP